MEQQFQLNNNIIISIFETEKIDELKIATDVFGQYLTMPWSSFDTCYYLDRNVVLEKFVPLHLSSLGRCGFSNIHYWKGKPFKGILFEFEGKFYKSHKEILRLDKMERGLLRLSELYASSTLKWTDLNSEDDVVNALEKYFEPIELSEI